MTEPASSTARLCYDALCAVFWAVSTYHWTTEALVKLHEFFREGTHDVASDLVRFTGAAVFSLVFLCVVLVRLIRVD